MSARPSSNLGSRFLRDERGATVAFFAVALLPLLAAVGAAIDYTGAVNRRIHLQAAVDSAAVRGCKDIQTETVAKAKTNMQNTFDGMFKDGATFNSDVSTTIAAGTVKASAVSTYKVQLGVFVGLNNVQLHANSECEYANNTYEIALVMDNSGSMLETAGSDTKIQASKDAAKSLIDAMYSGPTSNTRVKVSIVPFTLSVNAGPSFRTAPWVDGAAQSSTHWDNFNYLHSPWKPANRFTLFDELNIPFGGCFETRPGNWAITDEGPVAGQNDSYFVPQFAPDDPGGVEPGSSTYAYNNYRYENSYLSDNTGGSGQCNIGGNKQTHSTSEVDKALTKLCKYKGNPSKNISNERGPNYMCNGKPIMRMSNDSAALKAKIDSLVAEGNTNIFEGFTWGWRTISPRGPFADGRVYGQQPAGQPNNVKVMIVLTDGINAWEGLDNSNKSRFSPAGFLQNTRAKAGNAFEKISRFAPLTTTTETQGIAAMDNRLSAACTNAKAQGVIVYTIGFARRESEVNATVLKNCASPNAQTSLPLYYYASSANEVQKVFKDIANRLSDLRITK